MKMKLSYNYGFLGLGLGGTSIAAACADSTDGTDKYPYKALLINTNQVDMDKVQSINPQTHKLLIGDGKGAGRDITIGESIFIKNKDKITKSMEAHLKDSEFIWIAAGLGGGSGTGSVLQAIGLCITLKKRFGLILTLPRKSERSTVNSNALKRLNKIYAAMDQLGPIIVVDNEKLFNEFMAENPKASLEEYLKYSNEYVANAIHDKNIITANFGVYGSTNFDSSELGKMLITPGALHFARLDTFVDELKELDDLSNMQDKKASFVELLEKKIEDGVLAKGFELKKAKRVAISVLAHQEDAPKLYNGTMAKQLEKLLLELAPNATESPVSFHTYTKEQFDQQKMEKRPVSFYVIMAGLDLPADRIQEMIAADKDAKKELESSSSNLFGEYEESPVETQTELLSLDSLFGSGNEEVVSKDKDIFATLGLV